MRFANIFLAVLIAGCASEQLAVAPPSGIDLSGHWRLDAADSDDPQRLLQALDDTRNQAAAAGSKGAAQADAGAVRLPIAAIAEVMQWPGRDLVIKQTGGVAAFSSDGEDHVYRPASAAARREHRHRRGRSPAVCGWSGKSLVVQVQPDDEGPKFDLHYELSADGRRLLEHVLPIGAGNSGAALSRVWDRVP